MAGEIQETSTRVLLKHIYDQNAIEKGEVSILFDWPILMTATNSLLNFTFAEIEHQFLWLIFSFHLKLWM
jgi:hypothetical protein